MKNIMLIGGAILLMGYVAINSPEYVAYTEVSKITNDKATDIEPDYNTFAMKNTLPVNFKLNNQNCKGILWVQHEVVLGVIDTYRAVSMPGVKPIYNCK